MKNGQRTDKRQAGLSRRGFMANTAAAVAAFTIVPRCVLGGPNHIPPSEKINMGFIAVGRQGIHNMKGFIENPDVQAVALCDVDAGGNRYFTVGSAGLLSITAGLEPARQIVESYYAQKKTAGTYRGCAAYKDFRELLARDDIDAVSIGSPNHWHAIMAVESARAGKDIYCEKPLSLTIAQGRAMCDAVKKYGRVFQTGSHERSRNTTRFACELVRNGRLGKLHTIRVDMPLETFKDKPIGPQPPMPIPEGFDYDMWLGPAPWAPYTAKRCHWSWRWMMDYGGGEITDRGAHVIDLAQLGMGFEHTGPVEIVGSGKPFDEGLYDSFIKEYEFECRYANGIRMIGRKGGYRGVTFEGTDGLIFIHVHGGELKAEPESLLRQSIGPDEIHLGRSPGHHRNFLDCVKTRRQTVAPIEDAHRTATICHLINISIQTGRKLRWDPQCEQIIGDAEANRLLSKPMRSPWHL